MGMQVRAGLLAVNKQHQAAGIVADLRQNSLVNMRQARRRLRVQSKDRAKELPLLRRQLDPFAVASNDCAFFGKEASTQRLALFTAAQAFGGRTIRAPTTARLSLINISILQGLSSPIRKRKHVGRTSFGYDY